MSRLNLSNEPDYGYVGGKTLDELIPNYYANKQELDDYKKICDITNAKIKDLMLEAGEDEHTVGEYTAKRTVVEKESISEEKLMAVLRKYNVPDVIKNKEYVDMDALEGYLYNNVMSTEFATDLASCKSVTEVVQLRVTKKKPKKKKEDDE